MKNLKHILVIISIIFFSTTLRSQNFYITAGGGYAFNMNAQKGWLSDSQSQRTHNYITGNTSSSTNYKGVNFGLGKGVNFGGSVGYMFNDYLGIDLGFNYLFGAETQLEQSSHRQDIYSTHTEDYYDMYNDKLYSRMFRITPSLLISPNFQKINPYVKIGMVLGFGSFYWDTDVDRSSTGQITPTYSTAASTHKFSGGLAFGVFGSIGTDYSISENFSIFGELNLMGMSYNPKKMVTTKSTRDGIDQLPNMTTYEKETEYLKTFTETYDQQNNDAPRQESPLSLPFNSIGLNFGVKFNFQ